MGKGYDPNVHHRRSVRMAGYDYSQPGRYFVTMCTEHKECSLGEIADGQMVLREAGHAVNAAWKDLPGRFPGIELDQFVIMPNHVHAIIAVTERQPRPDASVRPQSATQSVGAQFYCARQPLDLSPSARPNTAAVRWSDAAADQSDATGEPLALGWIIRTFKAVATRDVRKVGLYHFAWQRNYYERIVRDEKELGAIREYIAYNPLRWGDDKENPERQ